jgi:hypothetical protein
MFVLVKIDQPFAIFSTGLFAFNDINLNLLMKSLISQSESSFLEQIQSNSNLSSASISALKTWMKEFLPEQSSTSLEKF